MLAQKGDHLASNGRQLHSIWRVLGSDGRWLALAPQLTLLVVVLGALGLMLRGASGDRARVSQPREPVPLMSPETVVVHAFEAALDAHDIDAFSPAR